MVRNRNRKSEGAESVATERNVGTSNILVNLLIVQYLLAVHEVMVTCLIFDDLLPFEMCFSESNM